MRDQERRLLYFIGAVTVLLAGLASRRYGMRLPSFLAEYAGDTLWSMMVFLGISVVAPRIRAIRRGGIALAFSFIIELSQLYHAPWIDSVRQTTLGGLVLGFGFLWTDFFCYTSGVSIGVVTDVIFFSWLRMGRKCLE